MNDKEVEAPVIAPGHSPVSREVSWWPVHEFVAALVAQLDEPLPTAGTPTWCALSGGDPRKLLALAVAGEHHVLRCELDQLASAEASKVIAAGTDWCRVAHAVLAGRGPAYIPRKRAS
ncbi:DUF2742 domain-containing protein [Mycobacteroides abscessus]|uniref:DUF2742 domain-containing protein n=1 Tax=Mycobacteroides abscessus TaxID=36809 RepID=UPI0009AFB8CB|nr:DUF2742 domain-containing protein [Mycobacteroides abscessus]SLL18515.1 putative phiRv1 phage protein [Mycobacteroides abscessus subsp. abscessus]